MPARLELTVTFAARRPWVPRRADFVRWAGEALAGAVRATRPSRSTVSDGGVRRVVLSVRVVGTARSRTLNTRYRHKHWATNVLSFHGAGTMPDGSADLGELVICAPLVAREASSQGKRLTAHWAHLTVHGALHLLGFDHERRGEARKMEATEIQVLDQLGFSNPYVWPGA